MSTEKKKRECFLPLHQANSVFVPPLFVSFKGEKSSPSLICTLRYFTSFE